MLADLLAPVGDLGHLGAQPLHGEPELGAVGLDRARISSGVRVAAISSPFPAGGRRARRPMAGRARGQRALDQLGLLDRELRRRRRALLDEAHREQAGDHADQQDQHAGDEVAGPDRRPRRGGR